mmetsp:Transcript_3501/g.12619  ORF Transcript_3501/g.12619 Transcript_3501/m.12619 type:complete len:219 (+) Transcript_3501:192-848(+)
MTFCNVARRSSTKTRARPGYCSWISLSVSIFGPLPSAYIRSESSGTSTSPRRFSSALAKRPCFVVTINMSSGAAMLLRASATSPYRLFSPSQASRSSFIQVSRTSPKKSMRYSRPSEPHSTLFVYSSHRRVPQDSISVSITLSDCPLLSASRRSRTSRTFSKPVSTTGRTTLICSITMARSCSVAPEKCSGHCLTAASQPAAELSPQLSQMTPSKSKA